jgi:hypothetical protein
MKRYLFITLLCFINIVCVFPLLNKSSHTETGIFVCRINQYMVYMENEHLDSEKPTYTIKAINLNSNEKIVIDRQTKNKCVNVSDTGILYTHGSDLMFWNLKLKRKTIFYKGNKDENIIGLSYNKSTSDLLLAQIDYKKNELIINLLNSRKQIVFCQKIKVNDMEMEGATPILETANTLFVFSVQDKLYTIDSKKLELKLISTKCDYFALNNSKVIYYKFITDEKTEGFCIDLITRENVKIDDSLNEKIYNCTKSFLFTANIADNSVPTYVICNKPYLWVNSKWKIMSEVIVYKDDKLIVRIPFEKSVIKDDYFQWELR